MGEPTPDRVYEIRRLLGPDRRHELPQEEFAKLLNAKAKELGLDLFFDSSKITRIEKHGRALSQHELLVIAGVDPLHRGPSWLAGWDDRPTYMRVAEGVEIAGEEARPGPKEKPAKRAGNRKKP